MPDRTPDCADILMENETQETSDPVALSWCAETDRHSFERFSGVLHTCAACPSHPQHTGSPLPSDSRLLPPAPSSMPTRAH
jgi:hypothetical protein